MIGRDKPWAESRDKRPKCENYLTERVVTATHSGTGFLCAQALRQARITCCPEGWPPTGPPSHSPASLTLPEKGRPTEAHLETDHWASQRAPLGEQNQEPKQATDKGVLNRSWETGHSRLCHLKYTLEVGVDRLGSTPAWGAPCRGSCLLLFSEPLSELVYHR